jgi:ankyrin repeat protein
MSHYTNRYFTKNKNSKIKEKAKKIASKARAQKARSSPIFYGKRISRKSHSPNGIITGKQLFLQSFENKNAVKSPTIFKVGRTYEKSKRFPRKKPTFKKKGGFPGRLLALKKRKLHRSKQALIDAVKIGDFEKLKTMLLLVRDVNLADKYRRTLLFYASSHNHPSIVSYLLRYPGIQLNKSDIFGITPLWIASFLGHSNVVNVLIRLKGINVNKPAMKGITPLHVAVREGHVSTASMLLQHPLIDIHNVDDKGETPLSIAIHGGNKHIIHELYFYGNSENYLLQPGKKKN